MPQTAVLFVALAACLVIGGFIVWMAMRHSAAEALARVRADASAAQTGLTERLANREARLAELGLEITGLKNELDVARELSTRLKTANAALETRLQEGEKTHREQIALLGEAQQHLSDAFKALSAEALRSNNQTFLELARETLERFQHGARDDLESRQKAIGEMVKPLRESIVKVDTSIQEMERNRAAAYAGVTEQVRGLLEAQNMLRGETANLVSALRAPTVRGRWGEIQLRRVVEMAGMLPYCDFEEQTTITTAEARYRPDMVIRLPNHRQVVVDAKVSLKAYLEALDSTGEETRLARLREHAAQVRAHLQRLGGKAYWDQFQAAPEFVVAFLPGEVFFSAALERDPGLIEFGVENRVVLATPTTLIALLKAVAYGWRQEQIAENAAEISALGKILYERLQGFASHLEHAGRDLRRAVDAYNKAVSSLESRVLVSARRFHALGVPVKAELPNLAPIEHDPRLPAPPDLTRTGV